MESNLSNKGRKVGSKNKLPNNDLVVNLINVIITDLHDNYNKLTTNQKIKILNVVKHKLIIDDTVETQKNENFNVIYLGNGIEPKHTHNAEN
jgi:hypothetical protein